MKTKPKRNNPSWSEHNKPGSITEADMRLLEDFSDKPISESQLIKKVKVKKNG